jgi:hypothetical protein
MCSSHELWQFLHTAIVSSKTHTHTHKRVVDTILGRTNTKTAELKYTLPKTAWNSAPLISDSTQALFFLARRARTKAFRTAPPQPISPLQSIHVTPNLSLQAFKLFWLASLTVGFKIWHHASTHKCKHEVLNWPTEEIPPLYCTQWNLRKKAFLYR